MLSGFDVGASADDAVFIHSTVGNLLTTLADIALVNTA
jgi:hypothetical protein